MEPPADHAAFFEGIAEMLGLDAAEPAFQARRLGARRAAGRAVRSLRGVMLDVCWALFELVLHR